MPLSHCFSWGPSPPLVFPFLRPKIPVHLDRDQVGTGVGQHIDIVTRYFRVPTVSTVPNVFKVEASERIRASAARTSAIVPPLKYRVRDVVDAQRFGYTGDALLLGKVPPALRNHEESTFCVPSPGQSV